MKLKFHKTVVFLWWGKTITFSISSFFSRTRAILSCDRPRAPPRSMPSATPFIPLWSRPSNGDLSRRMLPRPFSTLPDLEACNKWKRGHGETSYVDSGLDWFFPIVKDISTCMYKLNILNFQRYTVDWKPRKGHWNHNSLGIEDEGWDKILQYDFCCNIALPITIIWLLEVLHLYILSGNSSATTC